MRLREIYEICKRELDTILYYIIIFHSESFDENNDNKLELKFKEFCAYVNEEFQNIPYFCKLLSQIKQTINEENKHIRSKKDVCIDFCEKVRNVVLLYESAEQLDVEGMGLSIKIPGVDNITELKGYIDSLEFIFTKCPFFQSKDERLKLQSVENGSIWLIFGIVGASVAAGSVLLNNIAAFIDKCFVIRSHKLTCNMQKQVIESAAIEQKEKDELLKNINRVYKIFVENAIKELELSVGCKIHDGDERGRAEQSAERMIKLLDKGVQIHSALNAPEEVKALFAPLEMHYLEIGKALERIEKKGDKETE